MYVCMIGVIILFESELPSQFQAFCRLLQVFLKDSPVFGFIHPPISSDQLPCPCWIRASPQHDAATSYVTVRMVCSGWCAVLGVCHKAFWNKDKHLDIKETMVIFHDIILLYTSPQHYLTCKLPGLHDAVCLVMFNKKPLRPLYWD